MNINFTWNILAKGSVTYRFCPRETSYRRSSGDPPPPPLETSRTFFDFFRFILQALRLTVVYKSIKVHLGQTQELIMSIHIYLKCKYTYENAWFCILCIDDFKILKIFINRNFPRFFTEKRHRRHPPQPPTSIWRFSICDASLSYNYMCCSESLTLAFTFYFRDL